MFQLDCDSQFTTFRDLFVSFNVFARKKSENGVQKKQPTCPINLRTLQQRFKAWTSHTSKPQRRLKAQSTDSCPLVCSSHTERLRAQSLYCDNSWRPQLREKTFCSSAQKKRCFFLQRRSQRRNGHNTIIIHCRAGGAHCGSQESQASGWEWRLWIHKRPGFLR